MMLEVIKEPDKILHEPCVLVKDFADAKGVAEELLMIVRHVSRFWNRWLGFAANQIGYSKRIIVLRRGTDVYEVMVNPEFLGKKFRFYYLERCHSVRGVYLVKRYLWSRVKYRDLKGNWHELVFKGPSAIYQEIDHLNGILISDIGKRIF